MNGKLFLIPTVVAEGTETSVLPPVIPTTIQRLQYFLCENARTARRFVSHLGVHPHLESLHFAVLNKDTTAQEIAALLKPLKDGQDMGLLSESGCPAIADPGAMAVEYAHQHQITVVPLPGPSSLLLALMASGLNGQRFAFHGYLPIDSKEISQVIRMLERESREKNQTQLFIETPYRNNKMVSHLLESLGPETRLCIAANLTAPDEHIACRTVREWKKQVPAMGKVPVTFLFLAAR
ncbi:MAG: SAM-dependent methyltransferase [Cyclobacteriaceae bacterium]|nr:SAM-dependent methyltransferase [Cyclobacteriaceae bacterium]